MLKVKLKEHLNFFQGLDVVMDFFHPADMSLKITINPLQLHHSTENQVGTRVHITDVLMKLIYWSLKQWFKKDVQTTPEINLVIWFEMSFWHSLLQE